MNGTQGWNKKVLPLTTSNYNFLIHSEKFTKVWSKLRFEQEVTWALQN